LAKLVCLMGLMVNSVGGVLPSHEPIAGSSRVGARLDANVNLHAHVRAITAVRVGEIHSASVRSHKSTRLRNNHKEKSMKLSVGDKRCGWGSSGLGERNPSNRELAIVFQRAY
jgi:hypothetical protein